MTVLVESAGYELGPALAPGAEMIARVEDSNVDAWLVDVVDEEAWDDWLATIFETATVPVLLGEGDAPSPSSIEFQRWQKNICAKLEQAVGAPLRNGAEVPTLDELVESAVSDAPQTATQRETASCVWVLGASLGGPVAVKEFLHELPGPLPVAFVIAQHIDPGFEDTLTKVWGGLEHFQFVPVEAGRRIHHGDIVIAPIDQVVTMDHYAQLQCQQTPWQGPYSPCIDQLMIALAEQLGAQTGAILFSGMGDDGSKGAAFMRERGIEVWGQTAISCANSSMPDSARQAGHVTFSGTPTELAHQLGRYLTDNGDDAMTYSATT